MCTIQENVLEPLGLRKGINRKGIEISRPTPATRKQRSAEQSGLGEQDEDRRQLRFDGSPTRRSDDVSIQPIDDKRLSNALVF